MVLRPGRMARRLVLALLIAALAAWGALALRFGPLEADALSLAMGILGTAAALSAFVPRLRPIAISAFAVAFVIQLGWWSTVEPSNDRDWQIEVSRLPYATFDGDLVTIHDIRNFEYRSETDFTPRWYDKTFDLRELDSADIVASYWMGEAIAHIIVSFGFAEKDFVAVSIETRKERSEEYSTVKGFFRQYELFYVVADERDLIGVRTDYRQHPPEDVYLFRTNAPPENVRRVFLDYLREINSLVEKPQFYNTLTTNCTTNVLMHTRVNPGNVGYSWKVLLSGYAPLYVYENGRLDSSLPFEELKRRSRINEVARAADESPDFSRRIRAALPRPMRAGDIAGKGP
jgi:Domain of unknown function (DUF4105)